MFFSLLSNTNVNIYTSIYTYISFPRFLVSFQLNMHLTVFPKLLKKQNEEYRYKVEDFYYNCRRIGRHNKANILKTLEFPTHNSLTFIYIDNECKCQILLLI